MRVVVRVHVRGTIGVAEAGVMVWRREGVNVRQRNRTFEIRAGKWR